VDLLREDAELARAESQAEKTKVEELNEEIDELDQKVDMLTDESKRHLQDKRDQAEEIENLKDDLETGQADKARMERLEKEKAGVQEKLLEVEFACAEKVKQCKALESENAKASERIEKIELDLTRVRKQGAESQNLVDDLTTQLSTLEGEIAAARRTAKQHSAELKTEQEKAAAAANDNTVLTATLHKAQTQVIQQGGELEDLAEKLEQKERETRRLKQDLEELSATDELETKLQAAQAVLREKDSQLEEVNNECDELTAQVNDLTRGRDALQMQVSKLELQKEDAEAAAGPKLKKLESENMKLLDECDDLSSRNSRIKAEKESLSTRLRDAEETAQAERRMRQKADRTITRMEKKITSIVSMADGGGASAAEKDMWKSRYDKTREECEASEAKVSELETERRRLRRDFVDQTQLTEVLRAEETRLREQLRSARSEMRPSRGSGDEDEEEHA